VRSTTTIVSGDLPVVNPVNFFRSGRP